MHIKQYKRISAFAVFAAFIFLIPLSGQWVAVKNEGSYKVYLHEDWKSNRSYKAEAIYHVHIDSLYSFLLRFSNYPDWINFCTITELLDAKKDQQYIYYAFYDMPWPLANRDAVTKVRIKHAADGTISVSSLPADISYENDSRAIHVKEYYESFKLTPIGDNAVLFEMLGSYNPGGYIPLWVIKKILTEGPYDILLNIRKEIESGDKLTNGKKS